MGITEQIIFPEIDIDKVNKITGMDITFVTTATTDEDTPVVINLTGSDVENATLTFAVGSAGAGTLGPVTVDSATTATVFCASVIP